MAYYNADRRYFLRLSAGFTGLGLTGLVSANGDENENRIPPERAGPPDGKGPKHAGPNRDHVVIDYDDYDDPDDVYNVNDNRSDIQPTFISDPIYSGDSALRKEFSDDAKTANVEYRFPEHSFLDGLNEDGMAEEIYVRFQLYPDGFELSENTTVRIFWLPLTNGDESSGGGQPDGTNGWSNAIGFSHRNNSPAPDGYNFFSYAYHMDGGSGDGGGVDFEMTDVPVWMDEWNEIEGYVRCNTYSDGSANADGVMRYWVNGELAFERTEMRFTTTDSNRIEGTGPLGYVVGDDLSGDALIYDDHEIAIGYNPGVEETEEDEDDEDDHKDDNRYEFRDLLEESSTEYRDDFDVAIQLEATEEGEWWSFAFDAPEAGEYELELDVLKVSSYGIYEMYINDEYVDTIDFYSDEAEEPTLSYVHDLLDGENTIRFENVGRNEDATNHRMALYYLTLLDREE